VVIGESWDILSVAASFLKPAINSRSLIVETLTINSEESHLTYILMTQGRIYKIEKPYETENTKISAPQNDIEIEVMGTCEDYGLTPCQTSADCGWDEYCGYICASYDGYCILSRCIWPCIGAIGVCGACVASLGSNIWACITCIGAAGGCGTCIASCCNEWVGPCCLTSYAYP